MLDSLAVEFDLGLLARVINEYAIPDLVWNTRMVGLSPQERTWRLAMKGAIDLTLSMIEGEIIKEGAPIPLPISDPRVLAEQGDDILSYGMKYIWTLLLQLVSEQTIRLDAHVEEREEGATVVVDGLPSATAESVGEPLVAEGTVATPNEVGERA